MRWLLPLLVIALAGCFDASDIQFPDRGDFPEFPGEDGGVFGNWAQNLTLTSISTSTSKGMCFHGMDEEGITCWKVKMNVQNHANESFGLDFSDWHLDTDEGRIKVQSMSADAVSAGRDADVTFKFDLSKSQTGEFIVFENYYNHADTLSAPIAPLIE